MSITNKYLINFLKLKFSAQGRRQKGADGEIVSSGSEDEGRSKTEGGGDRGGDKKSRKSRSGGKMSRRAKKKAERAERKKLHRQQEEGLR